MKVVFRVDASVRIGTGHVMRCLTMADALRAHGAHTEFITRLHRGHLVGRIETAGHMVHRLPAPPGTPSTAASIEMASDDYDLWRGVSEQEDAAQTRQLLLAAPPDWLVVDHYGLSIAWERALRGTTSALFAVDDLGRGHDCDALLDQNWTGEQTEQRYATRVPAACRLLLGPRYALLRPEYPLLRGLLPPRDGSVRRVFVFFGGSDMTDQTGKALDALAAPEFSGLAVDVVLGGHPDPAAIEARVNARRGTAVHRNLLSLAGLMARADLAIGAAGATTWERMCLGLPTILVSVSENQRASCAALGAAGLVPFAADARTLTTHDLQATLRSIIGNESALKDCSVAAAALVDGLGTSRVLTVFE